MPTSTTETLSISDTHTRSGKSASAIASKFKSIKSAFNHILMERDTEVKLSLLAILSETNYLMLGPSGEGKTFTVEKIFNCFTDVSYAIREINAETRASSLFGIPTSDELNAGGMSLDLSNSVAANQLVYFDEIGKGSSSFMTTMMKLANTREFDNFGEIVHSPIIAMIASSNEPPRKEVEGFPNRFPLKNIVKPVSWESRIEYVLNDEMRDRKIKASAKITEDELYDAIYFVSSMKLPEMMIKKASMIAMIVDGSASGDSTSRICTIDTRKWVWAIKILKAEVFLSGEPPSFDHLDVLKYVFWDEPKHAKMVGEVVKDFIEEQKRICTDHTF